MSVAVVVPWRDTGDGHRADAWSHIQRRWRSTYPDWELIEGRPPDGPWCKGLAVADGLARTSAGIIIAADADVWCDHTHLAVAAVADGARWAVPHWWVHRLDPDATGAVLAGGPLDGRLDRPRYVGFAGGGITVIDRSLLEAVPIDPRFTGWGQEDQAANYAWTTLGGDPWRGTGDLWHLWHSPALKFSRQYGSPQSTALWRRYQRALRRPDAMSALIAETREPACLTA